MTPQEFQIKWDQALPQVTETVQQVIRDTPLDEDSSTHDSWQARQARAKRLYGARDELATILHAYGLQLFDSLPQWLCYEKDEGDIVTFIRRAARYVSCQDEALTADYIPRSMKLVRIDAPAWFKNAEFVKWLNDRRTATWHAGADEPHDYSDVFFTYCQGEGSDWPGSEDRPGIPEEIWQHLEFIIAEQHGWDAEVLVWVSNLE